MRLDEVLTRCNVSKATACRMLQRNEFPRPVKLGAKTIRFWSHEVEGRLAELPRSMGAKDTRAKG